MWWWFIQLFLLPNMLTILIVLKYFDIWYFIPLADNPPLYSRYFYYYSTLVIWVRRYKISLRSFRYLHTWVYFIFQLGIWVKWIKSLTSTKWVSSVAKCSASIFFTEEKKIDLHVFDQKIPKANISGHPRVILLAIAVSLFQNCNSKLSDMHHCNWIVVKLKQSVQVNQYYTKNWSTWFTQYATMCLFEKWPKTASPTPHFWSSTFVWYFNVIVKYSFTFYDFGLVSLCSLPNRQWTPKSGSEKCQPVFPFGNNHAGTNFKWTFPIRLSIVY